MAKRLREAWRISRMCNQDSNPSHLLALTLQSAKIEGLPLSEDNDTGGVVDGVRGNLTS